MYILQKLILKINTFKEKKGENLNRIFTLKYGVPNCLGEIRSDVGRTYIYKP